MKAPTDSRIDFIVVRINVMDVNSNLMNISNVLHTHKYLRKIM